MQTSIDQRCEHPKGDSLSWLLKHLDYAVAVTFSVLFFSGWFTLTLNNEPGDLEKILLFSLGGSILPMGLAVLMLIFKPEYLIYINNIKLALAVAGVCLIYLGVTMILNFF